MSQENVEIVSRMYEAFGSGDAGRFAMLNEVQHGKITRWTIYDDPSEPSEAAGLRA